MSRSTIVIVEFNTNEEAGKVYSAARNLKQGDYFQSFTMFDDYAYIHVQSDKVGAVLDSFYKLSAENDMPGIRAYEERW